MNLRDHVSDLTVVPVRPEASPHPAKYAPGLATALLSLAGTVDVGDPFAGTGRLAEETRQPVALNEIDSKWFPILTGLKGTLGCEVSFGDARSVPWTRDTLIFSPPYYPRTDRRRMASHDDSKRGKVVGYRSGYGGAAIDGFIGDPAGADGIITYRNAMREVFSALRRNGRRMLVVVKNQTRAGVELRLDLDTILTAQEAGWTCTARHGWEPKPSLWARYNLRRGTGVAVEDVLVFELARDLAPLARRAGDPVSPAPGPLGAMLYTSPTANDKDGGCAT